MPHRRERFPKIVANPATITVGEDRTHAEIVVPRKTMDDVSTLGDPFYGMYIDERTIADKTTTSSVLQSHEFWNLRRGVKKPVSRNLGHNITNPREDEETADGPLQLDILTVDDDASLEEIFRSK